MLKTNAELGFRGILKYPIIPPAIIRGIIFGIKEINTILKFLNNRDIIILIIKNANNILCNRFSTKKLIPFIKINVVPVIATSAFEFENIFSISGLITFFTTESNFREPKSATFNEILIF